MNSVKKKLVPKNKHFKRFKDMHDKNLRNVLTDMQTRMKDPTFARKMLRFCHGVEY